MNIEIERRFLVSKELPLPKSYKAIQQAYLLFDNNQVLRVRQIDDDFLITYKYKKSNINRLEFEYQIPTEDGEALLSLSKLFLIQKKRYYINLESHTWEIDVFEGLNRGLIIAEIELDDENEDFKRPRWIEKEISKDDKYLNFNLSKNPYTHWGTR